MVLKVSAYYFKGPKVWNDLDENIKGFSLSAFKIS